MPKRPKKPVERYHDRVAHSYDDSYEDGYWLWHDALTWDHIKPHLPADQRAPVVDLGCGTGKWAAKLAKSGFSVTGVDISHAMLDRADTKLAAQSANVLALLQSDLCDLSELPADHFALALAMGDPIGCTAAPAKALKEIRRILTPDGVLIATFDNRYSALDFYTHKADPNQMEDFLRKGVTQWFTRDHKERFPIHTYTPTQLRKLFTTAGYEVLDMIGKFVLPMRQHRHILEDSRTRRVWAKIEKSLHRDEAALGRASHLQIVARPNP